MMRSWTMEAVATQTDVPSELSVSIVVGMVPDK